MGKADNPDKQRIIRLVNQWRERSALNFRQVVARVQAYGCDLDENVLRDRLTSRPEREPSIPADLALAVISAFTGGLTEAERCRAAEALEFADLARLPLNQLQPLQRLFPEEEFKQAFRDRVLPLSPELPSVPPLATILDFNPQVKVSRAGSNYLAPVDFLMPLYRNDILYTYDQASATLYCKENKLILHVPEQNVLPVTCQDKEDRRVVIQLDTLIQRAHSSEDPSKIAEVIGVYNVGGILSERLAKLEFTIQGLTLNRVSRAGVLFQLCQEVGAREAALAQLEELVKTEAQTSIYLWRTLGELYLETGRYDQAQAAYQMSQEPPSFP